MFDVLFEPKFHSKCKSRLKLLKMRLETIHKKKSAMQKFLKKDIAGLLSNALDYNAHGSSSYRIRPLKPPHEYNNNFSDSTIGGRAKVDLSGKESQKPKKQQHQETKLAYEKEKTMDQLLMHYKSRKTVGQTHPSLLVMIVISYFS
ncbi:hypothetical protein JHK84_044534 [Glycine max]|uniref:Uncharacterized protein n=1 Tax=Glycine max TaxID=3847 RepID=A0A0R0FLM4_SOYBN|nr:hypothetical protein JHK86_044424 [Glycine max]KAG5107627.1 hypothetical protein JHK84_044534 [Glycine max]KAH1149184.1 hypothetical protein GYH30_043677 [Glycine max]